jgi:hypothetical protein
MDFIFEFLFQIVLEIVGQALLEFGFRGASRVLRSRIGRYTLSVVAGFGFGAWWGTYLSDAGGGHRPRLFWVSVALAVLSSVAAVARAARTSSTEVYPCQSDARSSLLPWEWPMERLVGFAALNIAIAVGIAVGYRPHIPG